MKLNFLNLINGIYKKATANLIINSERLNALLLRSGIWQGCLFSPFLFSIVLVRVNR
jgi:hypothetical protein